MLLLVWLQANQPDLPQDPVRRDRAIAFEAEIIDHDKIDIAFTLDLTEMSSSPPSPPASNAPTPASRNSPTSPVPPAGSLYLKGQPPADSNG